MKILTKKIEEITPYENNPRINDAAVDAVANSIRDFGFKNPVIIDKDGVIVCGHTRLKAAKKLGLKTVPCIMADDLTEDQVKAFRLADNKTAELAEWDINLLDMELTEIDDSIDMELYGFYDEEAFEEEASEEDEYDETQECETRVKKGDVWELGEHRLMCGDSFTEDISLLMGGAESDVAFCDPPYDMDLDEWISNLKNNKPGRPVILMASDKQTVRLTHEIPNFRQFLVHDREQAILCNVDTPMSQHTIISLFCDHPSRYFVNRHYCFTTVIRCRKDYKKSTDEYSCKMGKPLKVITELISHYSKDGEKILDLFAGGGSVLVVCEQIGRQYFGCELDPSQCDKIIDRWEKLTGKSAIKI